jgi:hypothetical protein
MRWLQTSLATALFAFLSTGFVSEAAAAESWRSSCRRGDRFIIQDLDLTPDPLLDGQRIRGWKVRIRSEANRQCETEIEIREGNDVVAGPRRYMLRPGVNEIEMPSSERYRFNRGEHCFTIALDVEGTRRNVDADRRFCARQRNAWSLREGRELPRNR